MHSIINTYYVISVWKNDWGHCDLHTSEKQLLSMCNMITTTNFTICCPDIKHKTLYIIKFINNLRRPAPCGTSTQNLLMSVAQAWWSNGSTCISALASSISPATSNLHPLLVMWPFNKATFKHSSTPPAPSSMFPHSCFI